MLYTPLTMEAMRLCFAAHAGQVDKCGIPYANHPLHLAERMQTEDETCVALLHDVMEDCGKTPDDLRSIGVSKRAIEALLLLTHERDVPYLDYVRALQHNEIARKVKVADLRHNSELARLNNVTERDLMRLRKYMEARVLLGDMAYELKTPVGPVCVTVGGKPYPFAIANATPRVCSISSAMGGPEGACQMEIETLLLEVGDEVEIVCDFGSEVVDSGNKDGVSYMVYTKDGWLVEQSFFVGEPGWCSYRLDPASCSCEIVENPIDYRFRHLAHVLVVRFAWKRWGCSSERTDDDEALLRTENCESLRADCSAEQ